jgi:hypothetical protein
MIEAITIILYVALELFLIGIVLFVGLPFLFGASYEGTRKDYIKKMIEFSKPRKKDKMVDLGSGNGKIVHEFAKLGLECHGYEINPFLVLYAKRKARKLGLNNAHFHWKNFWKQNLGDFNIITLFQIGYAMPPLERKLKKESKKGTRIVSNNWKFPNLKIKKQYKKLYYYEL